MMLPRKVPKHQNQYKISDQLDSKCCYYCKNRVDVDDLTLDTFVACKSCEQWFCNNKKCSIYIKELGERMF